MLGWRSFRFVLAMGVAGAGCAGPEDGRPCGGGPGGDGGNYLRKPIDVPSKIDGTKVWTETPDTPTRGR